MLKIRVWHIPQVPMSPFYVDVPDIETAYLIQDTLAEYDQFQFENEIKPDYSNASGIEVLNDAGEWEEYDYA